MEVTTPRDKSASKPAEVYFEIRKSRPPEKKTNPTSRRDNFPADHLIGIGKQKWKASKMRARFRKEEEKNISILAGWEFTMHGPLPPSPTPGSTQRSLPEARCWGAGVAAGTVGTACSGWGRRRRPKAGRPRRMEDRGRLRVRITGRVTKKIVVFKSSSEKNGNIHDF